MPKALKSKARADSQPAEAKRPKRPRASEPALRAALGKRKRVRDSSESRSPSPSPSQPDYGVKRRKRSNSLAGPSSRPTRQSPSQSQTPIPRVRAISIGSHARPPTPSSASRIMNSIRNRDDVLTPQSHPRPSRQLFIWGNGDLGQFGLGTDRVCLSLCNTSRT